jgi:hypothetical protein
MGFEKSKFSHHQTLPLDWKKNLETNVLRHTHDQTQNPWLKVEKNANTMFENPKFNHKVCFEKW